MTLKIDSEFTRQLTGIEEKRAEAARRRQAEDIRALTAAAVLEASRKAQYDDLLRMANALFDWLRAFQKTEEAQRFRRLFPGKGLAAAMVTNTDDSERLELCVIGCGYPRAAFWRLRYCKVDRGVCLTVPKQELDIVTPEGLIERLTPDQLREIHREIIESNGVWWNIKQSLLALDKAPG